MNLLREYIRALVESTQYDDKFKPLMGSGPDGIKQAMELADSLGITSQELPWDMDSIDEYAWEMRDDVPWPEVLEPTGWTEKDYRNAFDAAFPNHVYTAPTATPPEFLEESTEYDDKFKELMDSDYDGIKQAMELADSLGIPPQELPWDYGSVDAYILHHYKQNQGWLPGARKFTREDYDEYLEPTNWTYEDWIEAGNRDFEDYERELGLRESVFSDDDPDDAEKVIMLFFKESSRMGIQMAEMTPELEGLAEELDDFRVLVAEFVGYAEKMPGGGGSIGELETLTTEINIAARKLVNTSHAGATFRAMESRAGGINDIEAALIRDRNWDGARWNKKDQVMLDDLKDWARA